MPLLTYTMAFPRFHETTAPYKLDHHAPLVRDQYRMVMSLFSRELLLLILLKLQRMKEILVQNVNFDIILILILLLYETSRHQKQLINADISSTFSITLIFFPIGNDSLR